MNHLQLVLSAALAGAASLPVLAQVKPVSIDAPQVQLTMAQAVVIAEWMGQGKAVRARLDDRSATPVYKITVQPKDEAALKLQLAARDGQILASERVSGKD